MSLDDDLDAELSALKKQGRLREPEAFSGVDRLHPSDSQRTLLSFCSNDYLGLAGDPGLASAVTTALASVGLGAGASRLVSGESPLHRELERSLARYVGAETSLLFPSGYQANLAVLTSLAGPADVIVSDAANHASLIDGCRLSRAQIRIFPHGDAAAAEELLAASLRARRRFLLTESLFSMDGDRAPLAALATLASRYAGHLIVDEAHAIGVLGPGGRGLCNKNGVRPAVLIGTLGKAIGTAGGFVACSRTVRELFVNKARTYIYTTAPPPILAAAALAALALIESADGDRRRASLLENGAIFRRLVPTAPVDHIIPVILGSDSAATALASRLRTAGLLITAIRPPTVPEGTARLRITLSAGHRPEDIERLATSLRENAPQLFAIPATPRS